MLLARFITQLAQFDHFSSNELSLELLKSAGLLTCAGCGDSNTSISPHEWRLLAHPRPHLVRTQADRCSNLSIFWHRLSHPPMVLLGRFIFPKELEDPAPFLECHQERFVCLFYRPEPHMTESRIEPLVLDPSISAPTFSIASWKVSSTLDRFFMPVRILNTSQSYMSISIQASSVDSQRR
ncbi:hypothetical protein KC365_g6 [Hortaea werneckii]|nr:hypothetical protein KC339_g6 [Hortaea werneckii]KAI7245812.1 hypothetical protein KC365_g6 [Hortaea werneckii]